MVIVLQIIVSALIALLGKDRKIGLVLLGITICIYAVLVAKFLFIN
jgi:hypothetical protein